MDLVLSVYQTPPSFVQSQNLRASPGFSREQTTLTGGKRWGPEGPETVAQSHIVVYPGVFS